MSGSKKKREAPSYEEGRLRDKSILKMQDPAFRPEHLDRLIRKAAAPKGRAAS